MGDLVAGDITVVVLKNSKKDDNRKSLILSLAFGDGAKTYPAGGVPISIAALGCPNNIDSIDIFDDGISAYSWSYDVANKKLVAKYVPGVAHSHALSLKNAAVADATGTRVNAGTNLLGANTGSDITIAGGGANGGVAAATPGAATMSQPSTVAIAAQTLKCIVVGW